MGFSVERWIRALGEVGCAAKRWVGRICGAAAQMGSAWAVGKLAGNTGGGAG